MKPILIKKIVIRILDVDDDNQLEEKSNKGFGKSKKSKKSKRQWATKIVKVPEDTPKSETEIDKD